MPAHKDQPQSSSLERSETVSRGIDATPISNDFELFQYKHLLCPHLELSQ